MSRRRGWRMEARRAGFPVPMLTPTAQEILDMCETARITHSSRWKVDGPFPFHPGRMARRGHRRTDRQYRKMLGRLIEWGIVTVVGRGERGVRIIEYNPAVETPDSVWRRAADRFFSSFSSSGSVPPEFRVSSAWVPPAVPSEEAVSAQQHLPLTPGHTGRGRRTPTSTSTSTTAGPARAVLERLYGQILARRLLDLFARLEAAPEQIDRLSVELLRLAEAHKGVRDPEAWIQERLADSRRLETPLEEWSCPDLSVEMERLREPLGLAKKVGGALERFWEAGRARLEEEDLRRRARCPCQVHSPVPAALLESGAVTGGNGNSRKPPEGAEEGAA